jgi:hypothetical protein
MDKDINELIDKWGEFIDVYFKLERKNIEKYCNELNCKWMNMKDDDKDFKEIEMKVTTLQALLSSVGYDFD